jgi:hypothetical protein
MKTKSYKPINLKLGHDQFEALGRVAEDQGVPRSVLLRELISAATGVPDSLQRKSRKGTRARRRKKRP